jgi:hypothetical protein
MRLRELLPLRTLAAGTVMIANYVLVATFLNFHGGLLLGQYPDKITSFHASQLARSIWRGVRQSIWNKTGGNKNSYAAFFWAALTFAHRARCAAAIFLRAAADMMRFTWVEPVVLAAPAVGFDPFRAFAHLAFCARAIFRREAADIIRFGWLVLRDVPEPFSDSIIEIASHNFSTCNCASRRSARSCWSALVRFAIVVPRCLTVRDIV